MWLWNGAGLVMPVLQHQQLKKRQVPKSYLRCANMEIKGKFQVVTQPTTEPLTLLEVKNHLRIDGNFDDALLGSFITSARMYFESQCEISIASQELLLALDSFDDMVYLPRGPVQSIQDIGYADSENNQQYMDDWIEDLVSNPARITPAFGQSWPATAEVVNAVQVSYTTGYSTPSMVPKLLKSGMLFYVAHLYENRSAVTDGDLKEVPLAVESIIQQYTSGIYH
jgi:uncharacterized phiE125 gp8 family phage protein